MFMKIHQRVMDALIGLMPNFEQFDEFEFYNSVATLGVHIDVLPEILRDLEALGYVRCVEVDDQNLVRNVALTLAGRHYKRHRWHEAFRFARDSIVVPIAVSILTAALLYFFAL